MDLTPDQIKQMILMLQSMLPSEKSTTNDTSAVEENQEPEEEFVSNIKTKKMTIKKDRFKNKFNDMPEKNMHKEDTMIDQKLNIHDPTPRRKNNTLTKVQCRICGKTDTISSSLIVDHTRYKCNNCAAGAG